MTAAKDQVVALLPKLSTKELEEVYIALKFTQTLSGAAREPDLVSDWMLSGIVSYLVKKALMPAEGSIWSLRHRTAYKQYLSKLPAFMVFAVKLMQQVGMGARQRPQFAFVCASALGDWLTSRNIFSVSAMLSQIDKVPEALDEAFPGYVQAGLFGFVMQVGKKEKAE